MPVAPEGRPVQDRMSPGNPWTPAGVVRALKAFHFFRGRAPVRDDWSHRMPPDWPPLAVVERIFGSLPEAIAAAGVDRADRTA